MVGRLYRWFDRNVLELGRELRLSFLPPLMVYAAYGISGLTGIVGTFFVKDYLGLSAEFLAALLFWANIPWALKMPLGHLVDLIWRFKAGLVFLGAGLIALSLLIMIGLLSEPARMAEVMPLSAWYVTSALLAPVGYVVQDVVADAMTVEAVPLFDERGERFDAARLRLMHTTMQTLGRVAIVGGGIAVALLNVYKFSGVETMSDEARRKRKVARTGFRLHTAECQGSKSAVDFHRRRVLASVLMFSKRISSVLFFALVAACSSEEGTRPATDLSSASLPGVYS